MFARVVIGAAAAGLTLAAAGYSGTFAQSRAASDALLGRWDLVVQRGAQTSPSWLEVERSGTATLVGQFVGSGGSARPIAKIEFADGTFRFAIPPQWESNPRDITFEGRLEGDRITGSMTMGDGQKVTWSGTRAPSLRRTGRPAWGEAIKLFNGTSLDGWQPLGRRENQWRAAGGILQNANSGANLVTVQKFDDFGFLVGDWAAWQLVYPDLAFDAGWSSYGRIRPVHTTAVIFGFGGNGLIATSLYVLQRTSRARLPDQFSPWFVLLDTTCFALSRSPAISWVLPSRRNMPSPNGMPTFCLLLFGLRTL